MRVQGRIWEGFYVPTEPPRFYVGSRGTPYELSQEVKTLLCQTECINIYYFLLMNIKFFLLPKCKTYKWYIFSNCWFNYVIPPWTLWNSIKEVLKGSKRFQKDKNLPGENRNPLGNLSRAALLYKVIIYDIFIPNLYPSIYYTAVMISICRMYNLSMYLHIFLHMINYSKPRFL